MSSNIRVTRICQYCAKSFVAKTSVTQFCSDHCAKRAYKKRIRDQKISESNKETKAIIDRPLIELGSKDFLSLKETSSLTGVSIRTIQRLIEKGSLKATKLGRRTIIQRTDLNQLFI